MAQVPDKVLNWLYSVLHEYHDPQRAYSDIVRALSLYPRLIPRTRIYTYENGLDALLVRLDGTLSASFRGTVYHFPIKLHIPHAYPHEAPIIHVDPQEGMLVRPGQHVGVDGRVYHPYLRDWTSMWDRASLAEFLQYLQQVFAKEPPVISRTQQQQHQQQMPSASQTPPRPPPKQSPASMRPAEAPAVNTPPPVPPKPGEKHAEPARNIATDGPPLPPLPHELAQPQIRTIPSGMQKLPRQAPNTQPQTMYSQAPSHQNGRPPGPPSGAPLPYSPAQQPHLQRSIHDRSPVSPISPVHGYSELPETKYSRQLSLPQQHFQPLHPSQHMQHPPRNIPYQQYISTGQPGPLQANQAPHQPFPQSRSQQKQPLPDLLSDPFEVNLPGPSSAVLAAPPIPPNPEKEHLLHAISNTLVRQAQQLVNQNLSAVSPLQAQHHALYAAHEQLEAEIRQMEQLEQVLSSNEAILHHSIQDCDRTIATAKSKKQPPVDEVLIAPTMVANQLWNLCAEEAACREAMYVLQKAVDRGRISGNDFVRQMRALGRESFMKMALARKCARGMGLELLR